MKNNIIFSDKFAPFFLGSLLIELFNFYKKSPLDFNANWKDYEREVKLFLSSRDREFMEELRERLNSQKKVLENKETYKYLRKTKRIKGSKKIESGHFFINFIEGFNNFCQYVRLGLDEHFSLQKLPNA